VTVPVKYYITVMSLNCNVKQYKRILKGAIMNRSHVIVAAAIAAAVITAAACTGAGKKNDTGRVFSFAGEQLLKTVNAVDDPSQFPVNTDENGAWKSTGPRGWTSGFFPGCLWLMYEHTREEAWKTRAERWTHGLEEIKDYTGNHDVGFMVFSSYGQGYRLTQNPAYRDVILQAANSLATRYDATVGSILSWNPNDRWTFPVIVDNMMNLELLFWASKNGGSQSLYDLAVRHAETTMKNHVRPDGSTYHVVDYDPSDGSVRGKYTHQGYAEDSCWSRGQAWGIYGFTMTYRETNDARFLETASRLADYFIAHLPDDYVPYWDFDAPSGPGEPRDSSAASIAASALIELATHVRDAGKAKQYRETAQNILHALASPPYFAEGSASSAILLHGTASKPHGNAVDASLIYGDYYFLEALLRAERGIEDR